MVRSLLVLLFSFACWLPALAQSDVDGDDILLDATFVPCADTTESLLILRDGRAVYALGNQGSSFVLAEVILADLRKTIDSIPSQTDTTELDSCATLGVILQGPRYLLINIAKPARSVRELFAKIERLRKLGQRKTIGTLERFGEKLREEPDSNMLAPASVAPAEIRKRIRLSPVAQSWRCTGSVFVAAWISNKGTISQAFVQRVQSRGKCSSLLSTAALRAVLLASFEPATHRNGRPMACWMEIEVPFKRSRQNN